jgi:hypothetical protein
MTRSILASTFALLFTGAALPLFAGPPESKTIVAPPPESDWHFVIEPYGWALGLDGTTAAKGIQTEVDVPFKNILKHLDWAVFLQGEVRYKRWGIIANGFYAELSDVADTPGPLYSNVNGKLEQGLLELALAYRLVEGPRGYVDIFAGARYNYLGLDLSANLDNNGIQQVSNTTSDRIVNGLSSRAQQAITQDVNALQTQIRAEVNADLQSRLKSLAARVVESTGRDDRHKRLDFERDRAILRDVAAAARAVAEHRAAVVRGAGDEEIARLQNGVQTAEKNLAKTINNKIRDTLPQNASANEQWWDPFVGLRGQYNFNEHFFATLRGDVGGFSVNSDLAWQVSGSLGYNFNKNVFTEIGYRYLSTDYQNGQFVYDVDASGFFMGLGIKF